jgi:hypothetical protein
MVMQGIVRRGFPIVARNTEREMTCAHTSTGLIFIERKRKTKTKGKERRAGRG